MSPFVTHIIFIVLFDVSGIICAKLSSVHQNNWLIAGAAFFLGMTGFLFARSLRYEGVAVANIIWFSIATILITCAGYFFFDETITPLQFGGMALALMGVIMVNL